ncbi:sensor histidine kinase, partial [Chloroflexota bacterium]
MACRMPTCSRWDTDTLPNDCGVVLGRKYYDNDIPVNCLQEADVPDDVKQDLSTIHREAQRTSGVVKGLLTFARKHESKKEPVNINSIIEAALDLCSYQQRTGNIQVDTSFDPDMPEITADGFRLQQVFINLIANAEHAMFEAHGRG